MNDIKTYDEFLKEVNEIVSASGKTRAQISEETGIEYTRLSRRLTGENKSDIVTLNNLLGVCGYKIVFVKKDLMDVGVSHCPFFRSDGNDDACDILKIKPSELKENLKK